MPTTNQTSRKIVSALHRMGSNLDVQTERMANIQRELDEDSSRLAQLAARVELSLARIDALLQPSIAQH